MTNVWVTSDWHWGHDGVEKYRKDFANEAEMRAHIKTEYQKLVTKRDKTYFLGDMLLSMDALEEFKELEGRKVLVMGNHCTDRKTRPPISALLEVFDEVHSAVKHKDLWLTHMPMHPDELRGKKNVHGHTHYHNIDDKYYLNVCLEQTDWKPIDLNEIRKRFIDKGVEVLHGRKKR